MKTARVSMKTLALGSCAIGALMAATPAAAAEFSVLAQELQPALQQFAAQGDQQVLFSSAAVAGKRTVGFSGEAAPETALQQLLSGTGLVWSKTDDGALLVMTQAEAQARRPQLEAAAEAGGDGSEVEALIVTAQKREEDIQDVPIAISAFTQEALERSQVAGGPDLMTQVPNMTFTKTNFTGYSIQLRGIGTQAISATTDAAVAVAFNNTPFIRNRFFEQEFYDLQRVEVLRGPQGTLYGRNATAGVVNLISQKPKFAYEARLSGDVSNYSSTRLEGMLNIPLANDKVAMRLAAAWTKREGYSTNQITGNPIDGRDLWSTRLSLRVSPTDAFDANLIWEHFEENDDRLRSGKQLCHQDDRHPFGGGAYSNIYSQGCLPASLYSPDSFEAPDGYSLPYYLPLAELGLPVKPGFNPYASLVQSPDLRTIESTVDPKYTAKSDLVELQVNVDLTDSLTLTSETSYNYDTIFSLEDYNRFNTASGAFVEHGNFSHRQYMQLDENGVAFFCDPQIGCADRVVAVDVSTAKSSQFSQEVRLSSDYDGAFNFSLGANYLRYDTEDKYYVFINTVTMFAANGAYQVFGDLEPWQPGVSDNSECLFKGAVQTDPSKSLLMSGCIYIDPNPIGSLNDQGHNYFLSKNPYKLISYAVFGEAYYNLTENLKLTAGLRWTVDQKQAPRIPSWLIGSNSVGYPVLAVEEQEWREPTGRLTLDWKPDLSFTDDTLLYASYSHGYKAGGSNPPPSGVAAWGLEGFNGNETPTGIALAAQSAAKPKVFDAEFVDAFELGSKNTLFNGAVTLNLAAFYYDYQGYQISQIIDRSAVNYNFDATIWGLEVEADWRPMENLRLGFKGGYENTEIADGEHAIDIMERNAGHGPDSDDPWVVLRPFPSFPSNCVLPQYVVDAGLQFNGGEMGPCEFAYALHTDPSTHQPYVANPRPDYIGFNPDDPSPGHNNGEGFFKELGGNELPNAPHFTATLTGDYTIPLPHDWLATLHTDLYYQSEAWTRVFNMEGYDKLKAYTNVNVAAIFTNDEAGWKVMAYVKNVFDRDSITGAFLNSDDTGLTTNVFLTEPRLYGLRVTKEWSGGPWWTGANPNHTGPYPLTVEISGQAQRQDAPYSRLGPDFVDSFSDAIDPTTTQNRDLDWGDGREIRLTYRPDGGVYSFTGGLRYGRANTGTSRLHATEAAGPKRCLLREEGYFGTDGCFPGGAKYIPYWSQTGENWSDSTAKEREDHTIVDFAVGRDFGVGGLVDGHSTVSAGLRYAEFASTTWASLDGVPNTYLPDGFAYYPMTFDTYRSIITAEREFSGVGPALSWDAARRLWGNEEVGHVDIDWSVGGGVLFGKQKTSVVGTDETVHSSMKYGQFFGAVRAPLVNTPLDIEPRDTSVSIPFADLKLGLSYEIQRFKVGAGYRWERYFDVLDAGYDEHQDYDRTIDGPYVKVAIGFGG